MVLGAVLLFWRYECEMKKRRPRDPSQLAKLIVDIVAHLYT
jgi:hypothetical protein